MEMNKKFYEKQLYIFDAMEDMETPQHRNRPVSEFGSIYFFFQELSEIPQKLKSVEGFPNILDRFPLYLHLTRFPFFGVRFLIFWVRFRFSKKVVNSQFVDRFPHFLSLFPLFLGPFPLFLGPFPVFKKSFKFSVC